MNRWPKIDLWKLASRKGDLDETCENLSCDRVARAVVVISHSDGSASIKNYCSEHEGEGVAKLKRNNIGIKLVDHRGRPGNG